MGLYCVWFFQLNSLPFFFLFFLREKNTANIVQTNWNTNHNYFCLCVSVWGGARELNFEMLLPLRETELHM